MKTATLGAALFLAAVLPLLSADTRQATTDESRLAHMVYFQLKDSSRETKEKLVTACDKYLSGHKGTVHFSVGTIAEDLNREVNDRDFDVALHLVFKNKAAHDRYQSHPRHLKFIEECKESWEKVRVFDSYLRPAARKKPETDRYTIPRAAAQFAGMIRGKIVSKKRGRVVVAVEAVTDVWRTSEAEDAKALVGKQVVVVGSREGGKPVPVIARFLKSLNVDEVVTLDVAHKKGRALTILELTQEQRERVAEEK